jgi:hypothetical protein
MWLGVREVPSRKREKDADLRADDEILEWRLREIWKSQGHPSKMVGNNGQVRRCLRSSLGDPSLRSPVGRPARDGSSNAFDSSDGSLESDGVAGKTSSILEIFPTEAGEELYCGPDHADDAEPEEEDVLGCASDEPPSVEADESLIRSGVPESEGSGVGSSTMSEVGKDLDLYASNTSETVVSGNSWSHDFPSPVDGPLSPKSTSPLACSVIYRLVGSGLAPIGRGTGGTGESLSPLLSLEYRCKKGSTGRVAESKRVIRRDRWRSRDWSAWAVHPLTMRVAGSEMPDTADAVSSRTGDSPGFKDVGCSANLPAGRGISSLHA